MLRLDGAQHFIISKQVINSKVVNDLRKGYDI